ncbi:MAG: transcriptional regulator [Candidatus Thorarchaeota archaeon]
MQTRRERITELLEDTEYPLTAEDICQALDIKQRSIVYEDIEHIAKSIKHQRKELLIKPARCGSCEYVFKPQGSAKRPSKCPKCKSQWIISPSFIIRESKK